MIGRPAFDLRGQDGTTGGAGQDGGNGGQGGKGKPAQLDWSGFCKAGAGAGGNGGHGGKLSIYAPQAVINKYLKSFYITVDGGR
ncbi:hypothetical protein Q5794_09300 [Priestia megaterium]|uniref:hypothetical protein n=1 Tax=Priestia megaterium TaxID=1404 RepID=UPI0035BE9A3B